MKPLAYALWLAAIVIFGCGGGIAIRANRMAEALAAASKAPRDRDTSQRAPVVSSANDKPAPVPGSAAKSPAPDARAEPWKYARETAEQRKVRFTKSLPNSPSARAAQDGIRVRLRYHSFYAANDLTPAQIARFEKAMAGKMDPFANIVGLSSEEDTSTRQGLARSMDEIVQQTLGEAMVPRMREFIATADLREVADKLAGNTFQTDTPLTGPQAERLVRTCLDCLTDLGNGIRNSPDAVDWDKVLQHAQSFLSPTQLGVLRTMTDMRRFDQEFKQSTGLPYRSPVRNF